MEKKLKEIVEYLLISGGEIRRLKTTDKEFNLEYSIPVRNGYVHRIFNYGLVKGINKHSFDELDLNELYQIVVDDTGGPF